MAFSTVKTTRPHGHSQSHTWHNRSIMSRRSRKPSLKVKENLEAEAELQVEAGKAKLLLEKEKELQTKQRRYFGLAALFYYNEL